jgi:putative heme iron utilization protein
MSSSSGKHASGSTGGQTALSEPSFAERARTLMYSARIATLSTHSRKQPGFPFGSLMPYALDKDGCPVFLISTMAMHTQNLQADPRASLFVTESDAGGNPLGAARVTLIGNVVRIPESDLGEARSLYLASYSGSKHWVDFDDFFFFRMDVVDIYFVGGFGVMGWLAASEYSQAWPDPLVLHKIDIMQHMNADHKDALILARLRAMKATLAPRSSSMQTSASPRPDVPPVTATRMPFQVANSCPLSISAVSFAMQAPLNCASFN